MRLQLSFLVALLQCLAVVPCSAQSGGDSDVVALADSLSMKGRYADVVALLQPVVNRHPEQVQAWLRLAQHQYWIQDIAAARTTYQGALRHHPHHLDLHIAFARFLMDLGDVRAAKQVLRAIGPDVADAEAMRGTIAWWRGDLVAASRHFNSALQANPAQSDAAAALASLADGARPWVRLAAQAGSDSQPLTRQGGSAEAGMFITPLQSAHVSVSHSAFSLSQAAEQLTSLSAGHGAYWPFARLETEVVAGLGAHLDSTFWTGRLDAGFRLSHGLRIGARWERAPYLYTAASITQTIVTSTAQVGLTADVNGWVGEAVARRELFPDANSKDVLYGWLMAPLVRSDGFMLQAGYAFGYQHAAEHRFEAVTTSIPSPRRPVTWEGRYAPYHTPLNEQVHSVTGSFEARPVADVALRAGGSYGFFGYDDAPRIEPSVSGPMIGFYRRAIRPWSLRGGITAAVSPAVSLQFDTAHMVTAWYEATSATVSLHARF